MYTIGDKVQAQDGRIGTVIDTEAIASTAYLTYRRVMVQLLDGNEIDGADEHFKPVKQVFSSVIRP